MWSGMSGAVVVTADDVVVGVVRSHAFAEGGRSLTVTPLEAIDRLPTPLAATIWDALGVDDSSVLPRLPADEVGSWPVLAGLVPAVADVYQNRGIDLGARIRQAPSGTLVLAGLGGTGKTQLAAAHAQPPVGAAAAGSVGLGHRSQPGRDPERVGRHGPPGRPEYRGQ